jgi:hypothetical protein
LRPASKPSGFACYEYLLVYVDDVLILSHLMRNFIALRSLPLT